MKKILIFIFTFMFTCILLTSCSKNNSSINTGLLFEEELTEKEKGNLIFDDTSLENLTILPNVSNDKLISVMVYFQEPHWISLNGKYIYLIKLIEFSDSFEVYKLENTTFLLTERKPLKIKIEHYMFAKDGSWNYLTETFYLEWNLPEEYVFGAKKEDSTNQGETYNDGEDWGDTH